MNDLAILVRSRMRVPAPRLGRQPLIFWVKFANKTWKTSSYLSTMPILS